MSGKAKDILQMDLYGLLGVESTATMKEVCKLALKASFSHCVKNSRVKVTMLVSNAL